MWARRWAMWRTDRKEGANADETQGAKLKRGAARPSIRSVEFRQAGPTSPTMARRLQPANGFARIDLPSSVPVPATHAVVGRLRRARAEAF